MIIWSLLTGGGVWWYFFRTPNVVAYYAVLAQRRPADSTGEKGDG